MQKTAIDDFTRIRCLTDLTASPDGSKAAFTVKMASLEKNKYENNIWLYEDGTVRRLTSGGDGTKALWLDDETLLFPADRAKEAKEGEKLTVYNRISIRGGEAEKAFSVPMKVGKLVKYKNGKFLASATYDCDADKPDAKVYSVFDELPFWYNGKGITNKLRTRLYLIDPENDTQEALTEEFFNTEGFSYDADSDILAYWGSRFESLDTQKDNLYLRHMADGSVAEVPLEGKYSVSWAGFALGGLLFLANDGAKMGTSENNKVFKADLSTAAFTELMAPDVTFGCGVGSDVHASSSAYCGRPEGLYHIENIRHSSHVCFLDEKGIKVLTPETHSVDGLAEKNGTIYFTSMAFNGLQELYVKKGDAPAEKVSSFNDAFLAEHSLSVPEGFSFTDSDGWEIDGWVMKPVDYEEGKTYPAILNVHGGPRTAYGDVYFHEMQYWASEGYFVFFCNPRGGSGRGDAFADILGDNYGVRDYNDIMEFTDEVLKRYPAIDAGRVCMTGGSYGGFMANWIIGHTDRFAAVASQRSISNYISKCLSTDIGYYHNLSAIQADPWTNFEKMWDHSPLKYADKAKTPTLFIQSDEDYRCWMGDAIQLLQALLMHGVPAKMCLFHGENHELSRSGKPKGRIGRLHEITAWFDKFTKPEEKAEEA